MLQADSASELALASRDSPKQEGASDLSPLPDPLCHQVEDCTPLVWPVMRQLIAVSRRALLLVACYETQKVNSWVTITVLLNAASPRCHVCTCHS